MGMLWMHRWVRASGLAIRWGPWSVECGGHSRSCHGWKVTRAPRGSWGVGSNLIKFNPNPNQLGLFGGLDMCVDPDLHCLFGFLNGGSTTLGSGFGHIAQDMGFHHTTWSWTTFFDGPLLLPSMIYHGGLDGCSLMWSTSFFIFSGHCGTPHCIGVWDHVYSYSYKNHSSLFQS